MIEPLSLRTFKIASFPSMETKQDRRSSYSQNMEKQDKYMQCLIQTFVTSCEGSPLRIHLQVTSDVERLELRHHIQTLVHKVSHNQDDLAKACKSVSIQGRASKIITRPATPILQVAWRSLNKPKTTHLRTLKIFKIQRTCQVSSMRGSGINNLMRRTYLHRRFSSSFHPMWNDFRNCSSLPRKESLQSSPHDWTSILANL